MAITVWILGIAAALYVVIILVTSIYTFYLVCKPRSNSAEASLQRCYNREEFTPGVLDLPWEEARINSPLRESSLAVWTLPGSSASAGTAIFLHGITWDHFVSIKYALGFIERGWNVVLPDSAGHGSSPRGKLAAPSYGCFEKYDADAVVDWTRSRFAGRRPLILVGESMGAATALQYAPLGAPAQDTSKWKIDGIIADCSYSSLADEIGVAFRGYHCPPFVSAPALALTGWAVSLLRGWILYGASPLEASLKSRLPVLYIHGKEDTFVPTWMSVLMAEERKKAGIDATALALFDNASHAVSLLSDRERWFREVFEFIEKYCTMTV
jgi:alpha-beta hydrolase superfamily lysophospholipase